MFTLPDFRNATQGRDSLLANTDDTQTLKWWCLTFSTTLAPYFLYSSFASLSKSSACVEEIKTNKQWGEAVAST